MKLARSDWNKTVQLDQKCNRVQELERDNLSAPDQDDLFLFSFGEIERPRSFSVPWKPKSYSSHVVMVSQSKTVWKNYMKNSNENREMRRFASAIAMQSLVRGHFGRMVVKRRLKAKQLQAWYRGAHVRRVQKLNRCATIIQSTYRGHQGRKDMTRRSHLAFAVDTVLHQIKEHEMILNFVSNLVEKDEDIRTYLEQDNNLVLRRVRQIELYAESMQYAYKQVRSNKLFPAIFLILKRFYYCTPKRYKKFSFNIKEEK